MKLKYVAESVSKAQINWGGNDDPTGLLEVGKEYEVAYADVRSQSTRICSFSILSTGDYLASSSLVRLSEAYGFFSGDIIFHVGQLVSDTWAEMQDFLLKLGGTGHAGK